jgi:hypothetical protein
LLPGEAIRGTSAFEWLDGQKFDKLGVTGSSPVPPTGKPAGNGGFSRLRRRSPGPFDTRLERIWNGEAETGAIVRGVTVQAPAICDSCGAVFPSGFALGGGASAFFSGSKSGPCPRCGLMGSIPDGLYEVVDDVLRITSDWTAEAQQGLAAELTDARERDDLEAAESAIRSRPDLFAAVRQRVVPNDPGAFWALVAVVVEILLRAH